MIQLGNTDIAKVNTSGKLTTGAVTYPNADGAAGTVLKTDGSGVIDWAPDSDTLSTITCNDGEVLRWNETEWGCSTNTYASLVTVLEEQVASLQHQVQSQQEALRYQQEELLAVVQSQQEQIAQLQRMFEVRQLAAR